MKTHTIAIPKGERSRILSVLCIMTFIGSTLGLIAGVYGLNSFTFDFLPPMEGALVQKSRNYGLVSIISAVLTLIGASMMWDLNRSGFWMYLVGIITLFFMTMLIFWGYPMVLFLHLLPAFIGIFFLVMYFIHIKKIPQ
jgi:hypothetical protein